jgi:predicted nucleic acid-binding protein
VTSIIYLDTSALVKRYIQEKGSQAFNDQLSTMDILITSEITIVEIASALASSMRRKIIAEELERQLWAQFQKDWSGFVLIQFTEALLARAARLAREHSLRSYDAVHLAAALISQESLDSEIMLATFDRQLWSAAENAGLKVWPEDSDVQGLA